MKLLLCKECQDIVRLIREEKRVCKCGKVGGKYTDDLNAVYFGEMAVPIGFANSTLVKAVHKQPNEGMGENFADLNWLIKKTEDCSERYMEAEKLILEIAQNEIKSTKLQISTTAPLWGICCYA